MRTNIVIDDRLMKKAMQLTGLPTKRAVIEAALELLIHVESQQGIRQLRGKVKWDADLEELRSGRATPDPS